jgi:hypothetical protein
MAVDGTFSVKITDGQNIDNNPTTNVQIKEANLNLMPPLSIKKYELLKESFFYLLLRL